MIETLFGTYYGLDWISMGLGFYGAWIVGNRNAFGFVLTALSVMAAMATAVIADQYGFIVANLITFVICLRNWRLWSKEEAATAP
jgi:hypothetical protein